MTDRLVSVALPVPALGLLTYRVPAGHALPVASLAFAPNSQTLASGGFDNVVRLWDVASGAPRGTLASSSAAVL